eukprot:scaffold84858_cov29-Tisochrysis_lutea.AAC.1
MMQQFLDSKGSSSSSGKSSGRVNESQRARGQSAEGREREPSPSVTNECRLRVLSVWSSRAIAAGVSPGPPPGCQC